MGYQDNRSRFGGERDRERGYGRDDDRDYGQSSYGRNAGRGRDDDNRGFFDRAGDELRSWFGDDDARRRDRDDREHRPENDRYVRDSGSTMSRYGQDRYGEQRYGQPASYSWGGDYDVRQSRDRDAGRDPGYADWRRRQMDQLDRDYDEYRQHHQSRFDSEFATWRSGRQTQRESLNRVSEHMEVIGSDGEKIGTVDKVRGDKIVLARSDPEAGGHHHSIPSSWIDSVDGQVKISKTAEEAKGAWRDEDRDEPYGSRNRGGSEGPHNLNRAFSGTY